MGLASVDCGSGPRHPWAKSNLSGFTEITQAGTRVRIDGEAFTFSLPTAKANNFDLLYFRPPDEFVVIECKGGGSSLGTRYGVDGKTRVQQTTASYIQAIAAEVGRHDEDLGIVLQGSLESGSLQSYTVRQTVDSDGALPARAERFETNHTLLKPEENEK